MRKKLFFAILAALLLTPWPVAYAYDNALALPTSQSVEVVPAADSAVPQCRVYGNAIGGVTPGDLFYVDSAESSADFPVTLYITNAAELSRCYRYMTLRVGIYARTGDDQWEKMTVDSGIPETCVTLKNGGASFNLRGLGSYKITIDGGSFYCQTTDADGGSISPNFYLTVE